MNGSDVTKQVQFKASAYLDKGDEKTKVSWMMLRFHFWKLIYGDVYNQYTEHRRDCLTEREGDGLHFSLSQFEVPQRYPRKDDLRSVRSVVLEYRK